MRKPALYVWTPAKDAVLRERYDGRKGSAAKLAAAFGWPKWVITKRAQGLGLCRPVENRQPWTPEEERLLEEMAGERAITFMARRLKRSDTSVALKLKRMKISCRIRNGYTLRDLELCFGVDHHLVNRWIRTGLLKGQRRFGAGFAREAWAFTDGDLRRFVRENPTAFELRRVDQVWFLDLGRG